MKFSTPLYSIPIGAVFQMPSGNVYKKLNSLSSGFYSIEYIKGPGFVNPVNRLRGGRLVEHLISTVILKQDDDE